MELEENELGPPDLLADVHSFSVVLRNRSLFTELQENWLSVFREYPLTARQRRILVCGMNHREISQADIFQAIKTRDRDVYDRELTGLRNAGILVQIRTNVQAKAVAKAQGVSRTAVGRFRVQLPRSSRVQETTLAVFVGNLPPGATEESVRATFERVGRVKKVELPRPRFQDPKFRFGFVHYYEREAVERAIRELESALVGERRIYVRRYIPKVS